jgi:hypothetical protein
MSENPEATIPGEDEFPDEAPTSQFPDGSPDEFPDEEPTDVVQTELPPLHPDNEPDPDGIGELDRHEDHG